MSTTMTLQTLQGNKIDRKKLIQSYGFVEKLASNKHFLQESLELAVKISGTKVAYISLLDDEFQYILSQHKAELNIIEARDSICQFTIKENKILVIENTLDNELTKNLPQVVKEDGIVFYAGCPLLNSDNINIGALCVMDTETKSLSLNQQDTLKVLARQVMTTLDSQKNLIKLIKKINTNFKPAACSDFNCLQGELSHLQDEVVSQNKLIKGQKLALENTNKELVSFANMVAHDVRAPLRTINSFITLHEADLQNCAIPYEKNYLAFVKQATTNMDELTNSLLNYAKSGDDSIKKERINLNQILKTVKLNLTETINSTNAEVKLPAGQFFINGEKTLLIQLFQNLISNGLKYQSGLKIPQVTIKALAVGDKVLISVIDNGIGISKDNLKKIFEPFKRLHTAQQYSGSGIGLATCKKIVDKLGSKFSVKSELGKGSAFTFDLQKYLGSFNQSTILS